MGEETEIRRTSSRGTVFYFKMDTIHGFPGYRWHASNGHDGYVCGYLKHLTFERYQDMVLANDAMEV